MAIEKLKQIIVNLEPSSVYDYEEMSLLQTVKYLQQKIVSTIDINNVFFDEVLKELDKWIIYIQDQTSTETVTNLINNKLEEWYQDGTLSDIINEQLFSDFLDRFHAVGVDIDNVRELVTETENKLNDTIEDVNREIDDIYIIMDELHESITEKQEAVYILASDWGAVGDGVTDDTQALQNAINYTQQKHAQLILNGDYRITDTLTISDTMKLVGNGKTTILPEMNDRPAIQVVGKVLQETQITQDASTGDSLLHVADASQIKRNTFHLLKSQRNSLGPDSGLTYGLGSATANTGGVDGGAFYGEWLSVCDVQANIIQTQPLIFPSYKKDKTGETDPYARNFSTVLVLDTVKEVHIEGLTFHNYHEMQIPEVSFEYVVNSSIKNCTFNHDHDGASVSFMHCYNTLAQDCHSVYLATSKNPEHYYRNSYLARSSQMVKFNRCNIDGQASQPFDITYIASSVCSLQCSINDCYIGDCSQTGITMHPGTFSCIVNNCTINSRKDGLCLRGQDHIVTNCNIRSIDVKTDKSQSAYGIALAEGGYGNHLVTGNQVWGFPFGIRLNESNTNGRDCSFNSQVRSVVNGNKFTNFRVAIYVDRPADTTRSHVNLSTQISNNNFNGGYWYNPAIIMILYIAGTDKSKSVEGLIIKDNNFTFLPTYQPLYLLRSEVDAQVIFTGNVITGLNDDSAMRWFYSTANGRILQIEFDNNLISNKSIGFGSGGSAYFANIKRGSGYFNTNNTVFPT